MDAASKTEAAKKDEDDFSDLPIFHAKEHDVEFDPSEYLVAFYKTSAEDLAMRMILFFLPGTICRLPRDNENMLDLGAGPTIYVPIAMRHRATNIYTSDYAQANRETLKAWINGENQFDWGKVCEWIGTIEATSESTSQMQQLTRSKMRAVLEVNVYNEDVVRGVHFQNAAATIPKQFDVVVTIFCLEYATETFDDYRMAVKNALGLVRPGGYFVQGGVLEADEYAFGGRRFRCHCLTKEHILTTLSENGMSTQEGPDFHMIEHEEIFILVSKKIC